MATSPETSDTWLTVGNRIYTPPARVADVKAICEEMEIKAARVADWHSLAVFVIENTGYQQKAALRARLWWPKQPAPEIHIESVTPLPSVVVVNFGLHDQAQPRSQALKRMAEIRTALGKAVMVSAGLAIGTTTDTMRKRAAAAAGYCFTLARNSEGERRAQLALAGGLLYGASFAPKAAQLLSAVESARQVLARAWLASNREINKAQEEVA